MSCSNALLFSVHELSYLQISRDELTFCIESALYRLPALLAFTDACLMFA